METIKKTHLGLRRGGKQDPRQRLADRSSSSAIFHFIFVLLVPSCPLTCWKADCLLVSQLRPRWECEVIGTIPETIGHGNRNDARFTEYTKQIYSLLFPVSYVKLHTNELECDSEWWTGIWKEVVVAYY